MKHLHYETDLCVVGGGIAGLCTAVAAARHGIQVVLVHDRPVLGGNASSEIRMWVCGAHGDDNRETGIVEELFLENFYQNPGLKYTLWDSVLYATVKAEKNITLLLNSSVMDASCENGRIYTVTDWQSNAETFHTVKAIWFADCSGDSILAPLSGADFRYGREAKAEFDESIPPDVADKKTMGMSCLIQVRETDHPVSFKPPEWAYVYENDKDLPQADHRLPNNFWWIELGGEWDCIHDTDRCRDELLKICFGVWDHIKNRGDHGAENWELEWIGFLPGKRESRRYVGEYTVTQNDVEAEGRFEDMVAYAGWTMDDHFPAGFYYRGGHPTIYHPAPQPWGLPLRAMISKNVKNLVFAGRNISVTHAALSSSRVMATCGVLGQALGTAVAMSVQRGKDIRQLPVELLQNTLMADDCYLPWHHRPVSALTKRAVCSAPVCCNGHERKAENCWVGHEGDVIEYIFSEEVAVSEVRLVFDSDLNREYDNMPCSIRLQETDFRLPDTLMKAYRLEGEDAAGNRVILEATDCHQRFVRHKVDWRVMKIRLVPLQTHGCPDFRVFGFEVS